VVFNLQYKNAMIYVVVGFFTEVVIWWCNFSINGNTFGSQPNCIICCL